MKNHLSPDDVQNDESVYRHLPAGRYEFKDNGIYIGEWLNEKAVGIGLLTKDKSQGEYTGLWNNGSEKCGVFLWPSAPGAMYEGDWNASKRDGYGIFSREGWILKGKFKEGFITIGVKSNEQTLSKFEGEFEDGIAIFGRETYADGSSYCGDVKMELREGYGVRSTVKYGEAFPHLLEEAQLKQRQNLANGIINQSTSLVNSIGVLKLPNQFKGGFILSNRKSDLLSRKLKHIAQCKKHRKRGMKRSHSLTSVFSAIKKKEFYKTDHFYRYNVDGNHSGHFNQDFSVKSVPGLNITLGNAGNSSPKSLHSSLTFQTIASITANDLSFADTIGADVTETYSGQWSSDHRSGFGVCERSDGLVYEGAWRNNQRHGYGFTRFNDGSFEEGEYVDGKLTKLWIRRNIFLAVTSLPLTIKIRNSVRSARAIAEIAKQKANQCYNKLAEIQEVARKADEAAAFARAYSLETRYLVKMMYEDYEQPGIKCLKDIITMMRVTKKGQKAFETMLQEALDVVEGNGIPEMLIESASEAHDQDNLLLTDSKGNQMASRHGSFRKSNKQAENKEPVKEEVVEAKKAANNQSSVDPTTNNRKQLTKSAPISTTQVSPANQNITQSNSRIPAEPANRDSRRGLTRNVKKSNDTASINKLNRNKMSNTQDKTDSSLKEEQPPLEEGEILLTPESINATSLLPQEQLQDILTPQAISDYFNIYDDIKTVPPINTQTIKNTSAAGGMMSSSSNTTARRFTVPEIMSQPPVRPMPIAQAFCQLEEEEEEDNIDGEDRVAELYVIDNGIRKKVSRITSNQFPKSHNLSDSRVTLNPPQDKLTPLNTLFKFQSQKNLRKDLKEGSLPDVSETRHRFGLTKEETERFSSEIKEALELEQAKQSQGVLVIQLQRFLDWLRNNLLSVIVILFNLMILYVCFTISKDYKIS